MKWRHKQVEPTAAPIVITNMPDFVNRMDSLLTRLEVIADRNAGAAPRALDALERLQERQQAELQEEQSGV